MRREHREHGRVTRPLISKIAATAAATTAVALLPLGSAATAATAASAASAATAATSHEPASQLLHASCAATLAASAFHARGHVTNGGSTEQLDVYFGANGELLTFTQHGNQTFHSIQSGPSTYIKANAAFWRASGGSAAAGILANRWIDMTSDKKATAGFTKDVSKQSILQQCGGGGTATYAGSGTVDGVKVTKIHQNSNHESNTYYVEAGSTPYLLRIAGNPSAKQTGDLVFSDFGVQPNTAAPAGATPISQFE